MLVLNIQRHKKSKYHGYETSWARNIHERVDKPVFSIGEALKQINSDNKEGRNEVEQCMDDLFMNHLPEDIVKHHLGNDYSEQLGENRIRQVMREENEKMVKPYKTTNYIDNNKFNTRNSSAIVP